MYVNQLMAINTVLALRGSMTPGERKAPRRLGERRHKKTKPASSKNDQTTRCANTSSGGKCRSARKYRGITPHSPYAPRPNKRPRRDCCCSVAFKGGNQAGMRRQANRPAVKNGKSIIEAGSRREYPPLGRLTPRFTS